MQTDMISLKKARWIIDVHDKLSGSTEERPPMKDTQTWIDDDEELYSLPMPDRCGVLSSTNAVVELGERVWINSEQIEHLSEQWAEEVAEEREGTNPQAALWDTRYHFHDSSERTVNWILLLDAVNFCFWAEKDQPRWTIDYQDETLN